MRKTTKLEAGGIFLMIAGVATGFGGLAFAGGAASHRQLPLAFVAGLILSLGVVCYVIGILIAPSPPKPDAD
jgi:hypothetical protein